MVWNYITKEHIYAVITSVVQVLELDWWLIYISVAIQNHIRNRTSPITDDGVLLSILERCAASFCILETIAADVYIHELPIVLCCCDGVNYSVRH